MKLFHAFHARSKFKRILNTTFIALILKIHGAVNPKEFRLINLVSGIYKIIAQILANRLKMVLENIISKSQNAFIRGRQILNSILISNLCLDSIIRLGESGAICKIGSEKTYDHLNWDFQLNMLRMCVCFCWVGGGGGGG
jgi:hypothetical protein